METFQGSVRTGWVGSHRRRIGCLRARASICAAKSFQGDGGNKDSGQMVVSGGKQNAPLASGRGRQAALETRPGCADRPRGQRRRHRQARGGRTGVRPCQTSTASPRRCGRAFRVQRVSPVRLQQDTGIPGETQLFRLSQGRRVIQPSRQDVPRQSPRLPPSEERRQPGFSAAQPVDPRRELGSGGLPQLPYLLGVGCLSGALQCGLRGDRLSWLTLQMHQSLGPHFRPSGQGGFTCS